MHPTRQGRLAGLVERIGRQRDGSAARRAAFVCWICVPVYLLLAFWALGGWFISVDDPTLDGRILSYTTLYAFCMTFAWIAAAVFGMQLDHLRRPDAAYTWLVLCGYALTTALTCYLVGTLNIICGLVMMGAPLLGMMLFPLGQVLGVFCVAILLVLGASVASALGHLPYAPVLNAGLAQEQVPGLYYAMSGVVGSALYVTYEVLIMAALVTSARDREEDARRAAMADPLTGVSNRHHILEALDRCLARAGEHDVHVAVIRVDLLNYRDTCLQAGHRAGDELLLAASRALRHCLRTRDLVGRLADASFLVLLPETRPDGASDVADRCRQALAQSSAEAGKSRVALTTRVTLAIAAPGQPSSVDALLRASDTADGANERVYEP